LLILRQKGETLAAQLLEDFVLLLHEEKQLSKATMLDKLPLDLDAVKKHRR